jgi:hypothetical protein
MTRAVQRHPDDGHGFGSAVMTIDSTDVIVMQGMPLLAGKHHAV